jgi:hypothetical protein
MTWRTESRTRRSEEVAGALGGRPGAKRRGENKPDRTEAGGRRTGEQFLEGDSRPELRKADPVERRQ